MTDSKPLPCQTCAKLSLWQRLFQRAHDAERLANNREAAIEHVDTHARGYAPGKVTPEVKEIAEEKR